MNFYSLPPKKKYNLLDRFATGEASDNFLIDVEQGTLTDLKAVTDRESLQ
ncbi:hypothetical protein [Photobacterium rosenbergii]|nr:hypothetical protein [Photobacterium rosenbergii]